MFVGFTALATATLTRTVLKRVHHPKGVSGREQTKGTSSKASPKLLQLPKTTITITITTTKPDVVSLKGVTCINKLPHRPDPSLLHLLHYATVHRHNG